MQNLAVLLSKKYRSEIRYFRAVEIIQKNWKCIVNDLDQFLNPNNIYKNELVIECNNPVWMSEIDCFKEQIIGRVNRLLSDHKVTLKINGVKPIFNANLILKKPESPPSVPNSFEDRIQWRVNMKKENGASLCVKCKKVWDTSETCGLCRLTA
jgi:hypothetical protein